MSDNYDYEITQKIKTFLFLPFFSNTKYNWNFIAHYVNDSDFKNLSAILTWYTSSFMKWTSNSKWLNYILRRRRKNVSAKKILWLMYDFYNKSWFVEVEDISYENIWLRQIYENYLYSIEFNISITWKLTKNLKKFLIPKIFIQNNNIYELS